MSRPAFGPAFCVGVVGIVGLVPECQGVEFCRKVNKKVFSENKRWFSVNKSSKNENKLLKTENKTPFSENMKSQTVLYTR
ncbi:hypothetical protein A9C19_14615 [Bacillus weihaiensis]|uniref:Uncharacterized protein n=1 Tax=Bacillus weihaiensis TaxID=1547283 RepID=A0A1L3MU51_9BACI|nr:hypothetical protein A9C19_14615 [Bacillus weihaiensis]